MLLCRGLMYTWSSMARSRASTALPGLSRDSWDEVSFSLGSARDLQHQTTTHHRQSAPGSHHNVVPGQRLRWELVHTRGPTSRSKRMGTTNNKTEDAVALGYTTAGRREERKRRRAESSSGGEAEKKKVSPGQRAKTRQLYSSGQKQEVAAIPTKNKCRARSTTLPRASQRIPRQPPPPPAAGATGRPRLPPPAVLCSSRQDPPLRACSRTWRLNLLLSSAASSTAPPVNKPTGGPITRGRGGGCHGDRPSWETDARRWDVTCR